MKFSLNIRFRPAVGRLAALVTLSILGFGSVGCDVGPVEQFEAARAAAADKDIDAFSTFFTSDSAGLMRNLQVAGKRSRIRYIKKPFEILPEGKIEDVFIEENYARLTIKGRGNPKVIMLREDDLWKISLKDMTGFFDPLLED